MKATEPIHVDHHITDEQGRPIPLTRADILPLTLTPEDLLEPALQLYERGLSKGCSTGWETVDEFYTVARAQWTLITGIPGHGKSEFLDALMVNLAKRDKWRFAIYSPENSPQEVHLAKLLEKWLGKPFGAGPSARMTRQEIEQGTKLLENHFAFIRPSGEQPASIGQILQECGVWTLLHETAPTGIVIDPWNELEHQRPDRWSETEYISDSLSHIRRFARSKRCHVWVVAHPRILQRDRDGKRPIPTPYDVSGSAHWYNKADNCITVWRDVAGDSRTVQIHIQKVRFKHIGHPGVVELDYDRVTGRYFVNAGESSRRYRKAADGDD